MTTPGFLVCKFIGIHNKFYTEDADYTKIVATSNINTLQRNAQKMPSRIQITIIAAFA